ncbi:MAG: LamG domain-containing protein [Phaeodactylibacter sp.]|nr:LamG domain-containing protein [Phaeodactylibacter sp.]MCB9273797.1 LamG domain-containing protein [Lewinellaceae bacterium]
MKDLKLPALLLLAVAGLSVTPPPATLQDGLVAYYSFNYCDARDESGYGSNGVLYGHVSCWCGIEDDGLLLDGVNDYIEFPGKVNRYFNTTDFTVSFYFKPEQYMVFRQSLLSKRMECEEYNMLDLLLDLNSREVQTAVHETPQKYYAGLSPGLDTAQWVHFALVREGTRAYTYINGQFRRESFRCSGVDISNEAVLSFSNSPCVQNGAARRFKGVLDELRVYSRALSEEEIRKLYNQYPVESAQMDCVS